jgi:hypothetical protein
VARQPVEAAAIVAVNLDRSGVQHKAAKSVASDQDLLPVRVSLPKDAGHVDRVVPFDQLRRDEPAVPGKRRGSIRPSERSGVLAVGSLFGIQPGRRNGLCGHRKRLEGEKSIDVEGKVNEYPGRTRTGTSAIDPRSQFRVRQSVQMGRQFSGAFPQRQQHSPDVSRTPAAALAGRQAVCAAEPDPVDGGVARPAGIGLMISGAVDLQQRSCGPKAVDALWWNQAPRGRPALPEPVENRVLDRERAQIARQARVGKVDSQRKNQARQRANRGRESKREHAGKLMFRQAATPLHSEQKCRLRDENRQRQRFYGAVIRNGAMIRLLRQPRPLGQAGPAGSKPQHGHGQAHNDGFHPGLAGKAIGVDRKSQADPDARAHNNREQRFDPAP